MPILTDVAIKGLQARDKTYKRYDSLGLYLEITPKGSKLWRFRYQFNNKQKLLALGLYPDVSLTEARKARDELRVLVKQRIDPSEQRKKAKAVLQDDERSFKALVDQWEIKLGPLLKPTSLARDKRLLTKDLLPVLGPLPAGQITAPDLLKVLRTIEARGVTYTPHRARELAGRVFRFGVAIGWCERDIAADLNGALIAHKQKHQPAVTTPTELAGLLRALHGYTGTFVVVCALRLAPMLLVRPGELRHAEWREISLDAAMWRIPELKMKMARDHSVPLPRQAVEILRDLQRATGHGDYVFPGGRSLKRPMSENALTAALRRMGIPGSEQTWHGFRATASTLLHEMGWAPDVIEAAQARAIPGVRGVYNRSIYLEERKKMLQQWADYLDQLRDGGNVAAIRK